MEETTHVAPTEALLFIITCILIGISTKYFLSRIVPIPYTAILLVSCAGWLMQHWTKVQQLLLLLLLHTTHSQCQQHMRLGMVTHTPCWSAAGFWLGHWAYSRSRAADSRIYW